MEASWIVEIFNSMINSCQESFRFYDRVILSNIDFKSNTGITWLETLPCSVSCGIKWCILLYIHKMVSNGISRIISIFHISWKWICCSWMNWTNFLIKFSNADSFLKQQRVAKRNEQISPSGRNCCWCVLCPQIHNGCQHSTGFSVHVHFVLGISAMIRFCFFQDIDFVKNGNFLSDHLLICL